MWQSNISSWQGELPAFLPAWLTKPYILSRHLRRAGAWSLKVLAAGHYDVAQGEWQREIVHQLGGQGRVYAQVTMPQQTYERFAEQVGHLGEQALGETLPYHNAGVRRSTFDYAKLMPGDAYYDRAAGELWPAINRCGPGGRPFIGAACHYILSKSFHQHCPRLCRSQRGTVGSMPWASG